MGILAASLILTVSLTGLGLLAMLSMSYQITQTHLVISILGLPLRRIKLSTIVSVSKRRRYRAELWLSTWQVSHRKLVIRRDRGWFREMVITPKYRYVFRKALETAVSQSKLNVTEPS